MFVFSWNILQTHLGADRPLNHTRRCDAETLWKSWWGGRCNMEHLVRDVGSLHVTCFCHRGGTYHSTTWEYVSQPAIPPPPLDPVYTNTPPSIPTTTPTIRLQNCGLTLANTPHSSLYSRPLFSNQILTGRKAQQIYIFFFLSIFFLSFYSRAYKTPSLRKRQAAAAIFQAQCNPIRSDLSASVEHQTHTKLVTLWRRSKRIGT